MARCCGGGATCACLMIGGDHVSITGNGSSQAPFVIAADVDFDVLDNSVFNLTMSGLGTVANPWVIQAQFASTAKLTNIPDVNAPSPTNTQVLGWDSATSKWTPRAPTTAASGSVTHDTSLTGDGSGGLPLAVIPDGTRYITNTATGIGINDTGINQMVRRFGTAALRTAAIPTPVLNSLSALDSNPGQIDYWTGTQWLPSTNGLAGNFGTEFLALSGGYLGTTPVRILSRNISFTTNASGQFDMLSASDLTGFAGVLSLQFQETGVVPYKAMAYGNINKVSGTAYRLDTGLFYPSQTLTGSVNAYVY